MPTSRSLTRTWRTGLPRRSGRRRSWRPGFAATSSTSARDQSARRAVPGGRQHYRQRSRPHDRFRPAGRRAVRELSRPAAGESRGGADGQENEPAGGHVRGGGSDRGGARARGVRPVRQRQRELGGQPVADQGPGGDHQAGNEAGVLGDLGGVPGRELAGPDLRVRLPGEHRGLADVRVAAQAVTRRRDRPRPGDVVFSLDRNRDTALGGFYGLVFSRVSSIAATGSDQVTITLKEPDYWLQGELASMPGMIIEKAFAEKEGKKYGTPSGGIMC